MARAGFFLLAITAMIAPQTGYALPTERIVSEIEAGRMELNFLEIVSDLIPQTEKIAADVEAGRRELNFLEIFSDLVPQTEKIAADVEAGRRELNFLDIVSDLIPQTEKIAADVEAGRRELNFLEIVSDLVPKASNMAVLAPEMGDSVKLSINADVLRTDGGDISGAYSDPTRPGQYLALNMDKACPSKGLLEGTMKAFCNAEGKVFLGETTNQTGSARSGWYGMLDAAGICWQDGNCWKLASAKAEEGVTLDNCKAQCRSWGIKKGLGKAFDRVRMPNICSTKCDKVYGKLLVATERAARQASKSADPAWSDPDWSAAPSIPMHIIDKKGRMCLQGPVKDLEYMKGKLTQNTCNMRRRWKESSMKPGPCSRSGYYIGSAPPGNSGISMFFTSEIVKDDNWHDIAFRAAPDMFECYTGVLSY